MNIQPGLTLSKVFRHREYLAFLETLNRNNTSVEILRYDVGSMNRLLQKLSGTAFYIQAKIW